LTVTITRDDGLLQIRGVSGCGLWRGLTGSGYGEGVPAGGADQAFLLPPDMREWLPGDHPVWLVIANPPGV
jgi:hypothetical protein